MYKLSGNAKSKKLDYKRKLNQLDIQKDIDLCASAFNDLKQAVQLQLQTRNIYFDMGVVWHSKAELYQQAGKEEAAVNHCYKCAEAYYLEAIKRESNPAYVNLSDAYLNWGRYKDAKLLIEPLLNIKHDKSQHQTLLLENYCEACFGLNEERLACEYFYKAYARISADKIPVFISECQKRCAERDSKSTQDY